MMVQWKIYQQLWRKRRDRFDFVCFVPLTAQSVSHEKRFVGAAGPINSNRVIACLSVYVCVCGCEIE
jgi:hypothetical protein